MKYLTLIALLITEGVNGQSNIEIEGPVPEVYTIENIVKSLEGPGVIIRNVQSNQTERSSQIGHFIDHTESIMMNDGLIISTGSVHGISQANLSSSYTGPIVDLNFDSTAITELLDYITKGEVEMTSTDNTVTKNEQQSMVNKTDDDLALMLKGMSTFDACVVEFDMIPLGDTLNFKYLFGSEEYDEYVGSEFNDAFAFFISGPGIKGKKNLAVINNSTMVSINNINNGNPGNPDVAATNPSFYNRNTGQIPLEYDGFTRTLCISQKVMPYETYHLKIVIADASDAALDSGVLIEGNSIISYNRKFTIPFKEDAFNLTKETTQILDKLITVVDENPAYILEVSGHTDSDGDEDYNVLLSKERSEGVVAYILSKGVSDDRFIILNKGASMPIATNNTEEGKQANRRVEVKVIPSYDVPEEVEIAGAFNYILKQNFPNPTKGKTTVEAVVQQDDIAVVALYNMNGALIQKMNISEGQVEFDTSNLESGIYPYSLIVNGKIVRSKRLVVAN